MSTQHISFLVDQQMSDRLIVECRNKKRSYQPIRVCFKDEDDLMELSKAQALGLAKMLMKAAEECPDPPKNTEYPGFVLP